MTADSFFEQTRNLETVIDGGPSRLPDSSTLKALLADSMLSEYFFQKLIDPAWLVPLVESGKFDSVPAAQRNEKEGTISFPFWPQGEYLKRIVGFVPEQVLQVLLKLPATDNSRVHDAIADIALAIDADRCERLAPKIVEGIRSRFHLALPLKVGSLISRLSLSGRTGAATGLAEAALEIQDEPDSIHRDESDSPLSNLREPRARFGLWEYEQILTRHIPDLVKTAGLPTLGLLCNLLDRAILMSDRRGDECRPQDYSHVWRGAVEEHSQNLNAGLKPLLVSAVRDAAESLARKDVDSADSTIRELENRSGSWIIFRRIALHVVRVCSDLVPLEARNKLLDRNLFESPEVRHEYFLLERDYFGRLSEKDQRVVLSWIEEGPGGLDVISKRWSELTGKPWTTGEEVKFVQQWKRDQLTPLEAYLNAEWQKKYQELTKIEGKSGHPDFAVYHEGGAWGPTSPLSKEDLSKRSISDLVKYLAEWKPTGDWFRGPSVEGLARDLTSLVSADPEKYCESLMEFTSLSEPTYVRAVIDGFQDAMRQKRKFPWEAVLNLCAWAVGEGREVHERKAHRFERDPDWSWTRQSVVRLLNEGLNAGDNLIPYRLREKVWPGIKAGLNDPNPREEEEKKYWQLTGEQDSDNERESTFDPFTSAINSVRGTALQALMQYALWVRREMEKSKSKESLEVEGFGLMPEVREILESHLDQNVDRSIAVRAVYGERAPWLQLLDPKWVESNTGQIFDRKSPLYWHAAWDTYVCYCAPYDKVLEWLRAEYLYGAQQIGQHRHKWKTPQSPDYSLAQHIMSFYWRGRLELNDKVLTAFYEHADAKLRGHAMSFVGRSLRNTAEKVPDAIGVRIKALWSVRLATVKRGTESDAEELVHFGWWFASGKFENEWLLTQLLEALRLTGEVEPDHLVIERLTGMKNENPAQCVEALKLIVEGDKKGWGILGWKEQAKEIIRAALGSDQAGARRLAEDLVDFLGRRGHFDFGELLKARTQE